MLPLLISVLNVAFGGTCPDSSALCREDLGSHGECVVNQEVLIQVGCHINLEGLSLSFGDAGSLIFKGGARVFAKSMDLAARTSDEDGAVLLSRCGTGDCSDVVFEIVTDITIGGDIDFSYDATDEGDSSDHGASLLLQAEGDITVVNGAQLRVQGRNSSGGSGGNGGDLSLIAGGNIIHDGDILASAENPGLVLFQADGDISIHAGSKIEAKAQNPEGRAGRLELAADNISIGGRILLSESGGASAAGGQMDVRAVESATFRSSAEILLWGGSDRTGGSLRVDGDFIEVHPGAKVETHSGLGSGIGGRISMVAKVNLSVLGSLSVNGSDTGTGGEIELIALGDVIIGGTLKSSGPNGQIHIQSRNGTVVIDDASLTSGGGPHPKGIFSRGRGVRVDGCKLDIVGALSLVGVGSATTMIDLIDRGRGDDGPDWGSLYGITVTNAALYVVMPDDRALPLGDTPWGITLNASAIDYWFDSSIERCVEGERFELDEDRDGFNWDRLTDIGTDCDDFEAEIFPDATTGFGDDGIDQNCSCGGGSEGALIHGYAGWLIDVLGAVDDTCDIDDADAGDTDLGSPGEVSSYKYGEPATGCGCTVAAPKPAVWLWPAMLVGLVGFRRRQ